MGMNREEKCILILVGKTEGNRPLSSKLRWKDDIETSL